MRNASRILSAAAFAALLCMAGCGAAVDSSGSADELGQPGDDLATETAARSSDLDGTETEASTVKPASPSSCTSKSWDGTSNQSGWQAICNKLTNPPHDEWRAVANCVRENNPNIHVTVFGPWTGGIGKWSVAHCALNYFSSSGRYETRVNTP